MARLDRAPCLPLVVGLLIATGVLAAPRLTQEAAAYRAGRLAGIEYRLRFELRARSPEYEGESRVEFDDQGSGDLDLDFQGKQLLELEVNGSKVPKPAFREGRLTLPGKLLLPGRNAARVRYRNLYDTDGAGLHKSVDPEDGREYLWTQFEPFDANRLFPCFDQPDLKASYRVEASAPSDWVVIANAPEVKVHDQGGTRIWEFAPTERFSTYVFALCAGPYAMWTDLAARIPARIFTTQSMARYADPDEIFEVTRQGFDFFEPYFGIAYPYHKYDQVFVPQFNWGAMENVGCVVFNDRAIFRHRATEQERMGRANTILHEMAHMWFGDLVTMRWWNDLWLNESFATYMANLGLVEATRFKEAWQTFQQGTKGWAYWQDQLPTTHPIETEVPDTDTTFTNFDGITYGKGASVLKQLAFFLGADAFRKGVSDYLKRHRNRNARREDFLTALAAAAGTDLSGWTREWLQRSGANVLVPEIEVARGRVRRFWLVQQPGNGDAVLRAHRLQVALFREGRNGLETVRIATVKVEGARTRVPELEGAPAPDFVDANHGDQAYARVFLDPTSLRYARGNLERVPGTMARSAVWRALWFMVRDGAAPPTDLLETFERKIGSEQDEKLVGNVLDSVRQILDLYLAEPARTEWVERIRVLASANLEAAPAGSDLQKVWFGAWVGASESRSAGDRLVEVLDGKRSYPGLEIDQEKRWSLVSALAAQGHPKARELHAAESTRDPGQRGKVAARTAWAALPDPAVKAQLWKEVVEASDLPLDLVRAGMRGFWKPGQEKLLAGYVARYFDALPTVSRGRGNYFADAWVERFFPKYQVDPGVLARAQATLGTPGLETAMQRGLREQIDELERALRIRAAAR